MLKRFPSLPGATERVEFNVGEQCLWVPDWRASRHPGMGAWLLDGEQVATDGFEAGLVDGVEGGERDGVHI